MLPYVVLFVHIFNFTVSVVTLDSGTVSSGDVKLGISSDMGRNVKCVTDILLINFVQLKV